MEINILAVIVAAVASWLVGAAWYGILGKQWQAALGWKEGDPRPHPAVPMIVSIVAELLMAFMLAGLIFHMGGPALVRGMIAGALIWLGFVLTTGVVNNAFQGKRLALNVIDGGHWLLVLVVQGAVIGAFG